MKKNLELTKEIKGLEERIAHIEAQLDRETVNIYGDILDSKFKSLTEDIYKLHQLEKAGSYILQALPKEERKNISLLSQKELDTIMATREVGLEGDLLTIAKVENNNYKSNDVVVTAKLIKEDSEMGTILREYKKLQDKLKEEQALYKQGKEFRLPMWFVNKHLTGVKGDIIDTIIAYKGLDTLRPAATERASLDMDIIDYSEPKVIKSILKTIPLNECDGETENSLDPDNDLSIVAEDLRGSIRALNRQNKLDDIDNIIVTEVNYGTSLRDIAQLVGINHVSVNKRLNKIAQKISNQLEGKY